MNDDLLERAAQALRSETESANLRSGLTRARVLETAAKRYAGPRRTLLRLFVAITSVFVVGTALARVSEEWPALREVVRSLPFFAESKPAPVKRKTRKLVQKPAAAPVVDAAAEPSPPTLVAPPPAALEPPAHTVQNAPVTEPVRARAATPAQVAQPKKRPASKPPAPAQVVAAPEPVPVAPRSAELELFRRAQSLHLTGDPAAALSAWDAYLRVAANGVLAPEARYNRALCLVKLGRNAEARAALSPFAQGVLHGYRSAEAQALIHALAE